MRQIVVITVMVGLCLSALPAQAGPLREAAARAVRAETAASALQAGSSSQRRRSVGRTVGGILLMGVGAPFLILGLSVEAAGGSVCVGRDCFTVDVDTGGGGYGVAALGGALVVSGALLATVWADVPVMNSLDFRVTPQRVQVGKTFGFLVGARVPPGARPVAQLDRASGYEPGLDTLQEC